VRSSSLILFLSFAIRRKCCFPKSVSARTFAINSFFFSEMDSRSSISFERRKDLVCFENSYSFIFVIFFFVGSFSGIFRVSFSGVRVVCVICIGCFSSFLGFVMV